MKMFKKKESHIDGYIAKDQIIYGVDGRNAQVVKGLAIYGPSMNNSVEFLNQLQDSQENLLSIIKPGTTLQIKASSDCNYEEEILQYGEDTKSSSGNNWNKLTRNQTFATLGQAQVEGKLRRSRVHLFFKKDVDLTKHGPEEVEDALEVSNHGFQTYVDHCDTVLKSVGGSAIELDNNGLFEECFRSLNPSQLKYPDDFLKQQFDPSLSILENCLASEMAPQFGELAGFEYDSNYHGFVVVKALPQMTYSGVVSLLLDLPLNQFSLTLNIRPLDTRKELDKLESEVAKLLNSLRGSQNFRAQKSLEMKQQRIHRLMSNEMNPFEVQIILHGWDQDRKAFVSKMSALKAAVSQLQGAKPYEVNLPTSAKDHFFAICPGMPFYERNHWHFIEDKALANLMPITAQSKDSLHGAEALFPGSNNSIVAVNTFSGSGKNQSPIHGMNIGQTGSGKSCGNIQLISQTSHSYDWIFVADEGFSYGTFAKLFGVDYRSLVISSNGEETLNIYDTFGSPLSPEHLTDVGLILNRMVGECGVESDNNMQQALISANLRKFSEEWSENWMTEERQELLIRTFLVMKLWNRTHRAKGVLADRYSRFRDWKNENPDKFRKLWDSVTKQELQGFDTSRKRKTLIDLSYAFMGSEECPTHSDFCDWLEMRSKKLTDPHPRLAELVILLKVWRRTGDYGCLLDGVSTVDYSGKIFHLELGQISDKDDRLRSVIPPIITHLISKCLLQKPRSLKKLVVLEELGSFLAKVRGGKQLVRDCFERFRKYRAVCLSVIQQISNLPADLRHSVLGNVKQAFIYKQRYRSDAIAIKEAFDLPDSVVDALMKFPEPSAEHGAPFIYWRNIGANPEIFVCWNVASKEMLFVSESSGELFDQRDEDLSYYDDPVEGVIAEVAKQ